MEVVEAEEEEEKRMNKIQMQVEEEEEVIDWSMWEEIRRWLILLGMRKGSQRVSKVDFFIYFAFC